MTQIHFYYGARDRLAAVSELLGKCSAQKKKITVYSRDAALLQALDRQLWAQPALGFVPHCAADSPLADETPIVLAKTLDADNGGERLMNLDSDLPPGFTRYAHLVEVVGVDEEGRQTARQRVRQYKDAGHTVNYIDWAEKTHG